MTIQYKLTINEIYQIVQFISNKYQNGYLPPSDFNPLFNWAQREYFHKLVQDIQGWDANGKRIKTPMGNAQQAIQKIAPFKKPPVALTIDGSGHGIKPANLADMQAIRTSNDMNFVKRVEEDRVASYLKSVIDPIGSNPIYVEYDTYYQFYPVNIGSVNIIQLTTPTDAKWAYTTVSGRPVYDPSNSIQPLWEDTLYPEIVSRMMREYGVSVASEEMMGYFTSINQGGQ